VSMQAWGDRRQVWQMWHQLLWLWPVRMQVSVLPVTILWPSMRWHLSHKGADVGHVIDTI